jgi:hypothetical protein
MQRRFKVSSLPGWIVSLPNPQRLVVRWGFLLLIIPELPTLNHSTTTKGGPYEGMAANHFYIDWMFCI